MDFDKDYTLNTVRFDSRNSFYIFEGFSASKLEYNGKGVWTLLKVTTNDTWANTTGTFDYPLGTNKWFVNSPSFKGKVKINLNPCDPATDFNCNSGECVPYDDR